MTLIIDPETERLIEKKILSRFEDYRDEEIQVALHAVTDDLRVQGRHDITYQVVYQIYVQVMAF